MNTSVPLPDPGCATTDGNREHTMKFFRRRKEVDPLARQERDARVLHRELHEAELRRLAGGTATAWEPPAASRTN